MENKELEVFNLIMNGNLKQGLELASKTLDLDSDSLQQLIEAYSKDLKMPDEQLRELYQQLKK